MLPIVFLISLTGAIIVLGRTYIFFNSIGLFHKPEGMEGPDWFFSFVVILTGFLPTIVLGLLCIIVMFGCIIEWLIYRKTKKKSGGQNGNLK